VALDPQRVRLDGRVALVTGAAAGIGRAIALALARFGADVALCDRQASLLEGVRAEAEAAGRAALTGVLDVREEAEVRSFLEAVRQRFGRVDVLVNNAGGGFASSFADLSARGQSALMRENFDSVGHFVRAALPLFPASGGSIVNITSVEAHRAAPGFAVYAAMKAAVASLTQSLALELADRRIRVNCIAPDMIATPGVGPLPEGRTPLPGPGHPDDVAGAAVFLAGELSSFVTGTTLHVDGGTSAAGGWRRRADGAWEV
jgi:NAD(P)-dependent dehydrogenase (short-subunit alcohol dehydrogenase family)